MELLAVLRLEALGYLLRCVTQSQEVVAGVDFAYLTLPGAGLRGLSCPYMRYMADPQQEQVTFQTLKSITFTFSTIIHLASHLGSLYP